MPSAARRDRVLPAIVINEGERTSKRFIEFFTATIRNKNTRLAYAGCLPVHGLVRGSSLALHDIEAVHVAVCIEKLTSERESQTVKQHMAALRMLFDWMVADQCRPSRQTTRTIRTKSAKILICIEEKNPRPPVTLPTLKLII